MKNLPINKIVVFVCVAALAACGGGSGGGSDDGDSRTPTVLTGVFLDSPVAGMTYNTETQTGTTNADGEFRFVEGETITFSIGQVQLPSGPASKTVTPIDLAADAATPEQKENEVTNMLRLLQTLDADGNPENGITISADATAAATQAVDFSVPTDDFAQNDAVVALVTDGGQAVPVTGLVSVEAATEHFEDQLSNDLAGAWLLDNPGDNTDYNVVWYMEDGRYYVGHTKNNEPVNPEAAEAEQIINPVSGEYGTYTWNLAAGSITVTTIDDSDGEGGITGEAPKVKEVPVELNDSSIPTDEGGVLEISKVRSATSGIVGGWLHEPSDDPTDYNVLVFTADGRYFNGHTKQSGSIVASGEYGTYSWNASTGAFQATLINESDDDGGITQGNNSITGTLTISADGLTLFDSGEELAKRVGK
ncbi:hypothetical protein [Thalassolituus alkanivorans]|uniref:hypothetical protein n=1 Tax=Thalassolituus alkanivorans TaxID=2881055 RepID=UPI001E4E0B30|nr:hypothetical protein [Thalassolituus alkanivorans]MCB2422799.1 hypothetical protein [Thalassolituus alkanivorans]